MGKFGWAVVVWFYFGFFIFSVRVSRCFLSFGFGGLSFRRRFSMVFRVVFMVVYSEFFRLAL